MQIGTKSRFSPVKFPGVRESAVGAWLRVQNEIRWGKVKGIPEITRKPPRNCTQALPDISQIPVGYFIVLLHHSIIFVLLLDYI